MIEVKSYIAVESTITIGELERGELAKVVSDDAFTGSILLKTALGVVIVHNPKRDVQTFDGWPSSSRPSLRLRRLRAGDSIALQVTK